MTRTGRTGRVLLPAVVALLASTVLTGPGPASASAPPRAAAHVAATEPPPPAVPKPFGKLTCMPRDGIRFCGGGMVGGKDLRVPSFDGVPLDADVSLPATGRGPFPLMVLLNGLGEAKQEFEVTTDDGGIDDVSLSDRGYAVLMYTARGFGESCGTPASRRHTPACAKGWIELADQRYEIRDTQYLAGELVDEGLVRPDIAVGGASYGAGQTLELTALKNRIRLPDGALAPFTSPRLHIPMAVAAGFAIWPWDDLVSALVPNGSLNDQGTTPAVDDRQPVGVPKFAWTSALYQVTQTGYLAKPHQDPQADLTVWEKELLVDSPSIARSPAATSALKIIQTYKSAIGVPPAKGGPAPTIIMSGWTDSLFPSTEALHYQAQAQAAGGHTPLLLILADIGHGWARNANADAIRGYTLGLNFLHDIFFSHTTPQSAVVAMAETCAPPADPAPEIAGQSLAALASPGAQASFAGPQNQTVTSSGGLAATAKALDASTATRCAPFSGTLGPGVATYRGPGGFTAVGAVTIAATLKITGHDPELAAQLWDVAPDGTRTPVSLGIYRPPVAQSLSGKGGGTEHVSFQLDPTYYQFPAGDTAQVEIEGSDAPFFRASGTAFTVTLVHAQVSIPVRAPSAVSPPIPTS